MERGPAAGAARGGPANTFSERGNWRDTARPTEKSSLPPNHPRKSAESATAQSVAKSKKPALKLTPRSKPVVEGDQLASEEYKKSNKPNPFGDARPKEIVLAEKKESTGK